MAIKEAFKLSETILYTKLDGGGMSCKRMRAHKFHATNQEE